MANNPFLARGSDDKDPEDPSTTSMAYDFMLPKWAMVQTLLDGTEAMRRAESRYLPQHEQESDRNYAERLHRCTLFNMTELTLDSLVGKPFSEPVDIGDDVPAEIVDLLPDIDLQGNDFTVVAREWFRDGLAKAFSHILVDMPAMSDEDAEGRTLEDDNRERRRPYWVHVKPESVIFAAAEIVDGQEVLTHVRILEEEVVRNGFAEKVRIRIRVLEPGFFQVLEQRQDKRRKKPKWVVVEEGETGLPFIPLITFYANRESLMVGKPPIEDLAHLNVRHWQSTADQINILTVARFPMLAVAGAHDETGNVMAIGPRQLLATRDPNGRFYYVEHTGKAIGAGKDDLADLEQQMAAYGAEFLRRKAGNEVATVRALDSAESTSALQDMTNRFAESLNLALQVTAEWMGLDEAGTLKVKTDFLGISDEVKAMLDGLAEARKNGDISRVGYLQELQRFGVLREEFDFDANDSKLLEEAEEAMRRAAEQAALQQQGQDDQSQQESGGDE